MNKAIVKEILVSLDEDRVFLIDAFCLGKESKVGPNAKQRLIKVHVDNSTQRTAILCKAKILKDTIISFLLDIDRLMLNNNMLESLSSSLLGCPKTQKTAQKKIGFTCQSFQRYVVCSTILFGDEFWNASSMYLNECIERFVPIRIVSRKPPCLQWKPSHLLL